MRADDKLDLCNIAAPYCLLICKSTLASMKPGAVLEIHVQDPEGLKDLLTILSRSGDQVIHREEAKDRTCLWVRKGLLERSSPSPCPGAPR